MRILYVTTVSRTMSFFKKIVEQLVKEGHQVDLACNVNEIEVDKFFEELNCKVFSLSCERSPLNANNILAVREINRLVDENKYDIVHCHTPIAAFCTRIGCLKHRRNGLKVIYTAHGFHFYKGSSIRNWMMYFPLEWICSWFTDIIVTINTEDYKIACNRLHSKQVEYIPGVGIDTSKFFYNNAKRDKKRKEIGVPEDAFLVLSVGELNQNKNHEIVLNCISGMSQNIYYIIAGEGLLKDALEEKASSLGISDRVRLLGYRDDIGELYNASDVLIHPSYREGLSVTIMESMATKLPILCSDIRGNRDLVHHECLFNPYLVNELKEKLLRIMNEKDFVSEIVDYNFENIEKNDFRIINKQVLGLYNKIICEGKK